MKDDILRHLNYTLARDPELATSHDWWNATCLALRDRMLARAKQTMLTHRQEKVRRVYYLSLEYLMGRLLENNLLNLELLAPARTALQELGQDLDHLLEEEPDMGLGNGGLGRLASCFLDSMATLNLPSVGYGIHYEFGLFKQSFQQHQQIEQPDVWRRYGNPWQLCRPEYSIEVPLYGEVHDHYNDAGHHHPQWNPARTILGVPWDIPIVGYQASSVNFLRLWESKASEEFNFQVFNQGGYIEAIREKATSESISKVLYPNDATESGKELRLVQQYFFVCCSLHDILRRFDCEHGQDWATFPDFICLQLNDTHPAIAIPELMRIFLDEKGLDWDQAWAICQQSFAYTNHTLLPEALETWSVDLLGRVLPRHLQLIYEINTRFLANDVEKQWPGDDEKKRQLSIIEEGPQKRVRMAFMSIVGSFSTNGVAALHSKLLQEKVFPEFHQLYPKRLNNKTNGITPRRWLMACNPELSALYTKHVGKDWPRDLTHLAGLATKATDPKLQKEFMAIKARNKAQLAATLKDLCHLDINTEAIFDVQIKRLHEYKRQHLNLLHILTLYQKLLDNPKLETAPRLFLFGAKAAPGYTLAKTIIHAINAVGEIINHDPRVEGKLQVAFPANYRVSLAEKIIPAADLSEQISTAGKEASGTGNMKLSLNGALTIGTLDGANVEIKDAVGEENIFIFGHTVEEIEALKQNGYNPWDHYWNQEDLRRSLDWLCSGHFSGGDRQVFAPIKESLLDHSDPYFVLADFAAYVQAQEQVAAAWANPSDWARMAIINSAKVGFFSSDRTISQYAEEIWQLPPVAIPAS